MPTLEERVAYIEGHVNEQSHVWVDTRDAIRHLEAETRDAIRHLEQRLDRLEQRMDARFEGVERRFEGVDRRFELLDDKVSRQFVWLVGIQVTTLIAIVGALLARA